MLEAPMLSRLFVTGTPDEAPRLDPRSESFRGLLGPPDRAGVLALVVEVEPKRSAAAFEAFVLPSRSFAFMCRNRCARLPAVMRPSAISAASAEVFALRLPSSSAMPSAIDFLGMSRDGPLESDDPGLAYAFREGVLPGVVEGGRTNPTVLDRLR